MNDFCIKKGYKIRTTPMYCSRNKNSMKNQLFIYESMVDSDYETVLDLGCGYAEKLIRFYSKRKTIGVDFGKNIKHCKKKYPKRTWFSKNLEKEFPGMYNNALVFCVDMIEHLVNPSPLLKYLSQLSKNNYMVISTPNRDVICGVGFMGPPKHKDHVREWNEFEFNQLLQKYGMDLNVKTIKRHIVATSS